MKKTNWYSSFAHNFDFDRMTFAFDSDKCGEKKTQNINRNNTRTNENQRNRKQTRVNISQNIVHKYAFRSEFLRQMRSVWDRYIEYG